MVAPKNVWLLWRFWVVVPSSSKGHLVQLDKRRADLYQTPEHTKLDLVLKPSGSHILPLPNTAMTFRPNGFQLPAVFSVSRV